MVDSNQERVTKTSSAKAYHEFGLVFEGLPTIHSWSLLAFIFLHLWFCSFRLHRKWLDSPDGKEALTVFSEREVFVCYAPNWAHLTVKSANTTLKTGGWTALPALLATKGSSQLNLVADSADGVGGLGFRGLRRMSRTGGLRGAGHGRRIKIHAGPIRF